MLDQKFWKKYFESYDVLNSAIPYQRLLNKIVEKAEIKKGDIVLDAGSGTGNLSLKIKQKGARPLSLDFSKEGLDMHKNKDNGAEVYLRDLTKRLPFEDNFFDKIVSNNVIYAIPKEKRKKIFDEFYRVLKPGGVIVIANVHKNFKPSVILFDHIFKSFRKFGLLKTFYDLFSLLSSTIKILYFNYLIKKENSFGSYDFLEGKDYQVLFRQSNFKNVSEPILAYSNQSYISKAIK